MAQQRRGGRKRRKVDYIAANHIEYIDYKDTELLKRFISERGKIYHVVLQVLALKTNVN